MSKSKVSSSAFNRILFGNTDKIPVLLQAMKEDPPAGYKCRDKFLVQSVAITADKEYNSVQQIVRFLPGMSLKVTRLLTSLPVGSCRKA